MQKISCYKCGNIWEFDPPLGRRELCPSCGVDARCCFNCKFYKASAYRECAEPQASWVKEKNQGNFCGYFSANSQERTAGGSNEHLSKLESLFKGGSGQPKESTGLKDDLEQFLKNRK
ncbi:MAG: hypothetical protein AB7T49_09435 [Oligoflexales bacterium]